MKYRKNIQRIFSKDWKNLPYQRGSVIQMDTARGPPFVFCLLNS